MPPHKLHSDSTTSKDSLGRKELAKGIARTLIHAKPAGNESIVFGLNGRWGSGKSTLLHFIEEEIKEIHSNNKDEKYVIFQFNPWMFSGQEQLIWSFYRSLIKEIKNPGGGLRKYASQIGELLEDSILDKIISDSPFSKQVKQGKQMISHLLKEGTLEDIRRKLNEILVKEKIRMYVVMDDLDRLMPNEIIQIFQLVKLSANFKNTVFLLAYDKEIIVNAVEQTFKNNGERYLSKIVQIDYTVPEMLEEDIERIFFEQLENFFDDFNIPFINESKGLKKYWSQYGLKNYFLTLRDVYRYINGLAFRLPVVWEYVNITHFLLLEAIRVFDHEGYQTLYTKCLDSLRRTASFPNLRLKDNQVKSISKNSTTQELLITVQGPYKSGNPLSKKTASKDLFSHDAFERYFSMRISNSDLPEKEFQVFIKNPDRMRANLDKIKQSHRLENFLSRLASSDWENRFPNNGAEVGPVLIAFFDSIDTEQRHHLLPRLLEIIQKIKTSNKEKKNNLDQIEAEMFSLGNSYPKTTHFMLLYNLWDKQEPIEKTSKSKEQRKIIRKISEYTIRWSLEVAKEIPHNIRDTKFSLAMFDAFSLLNPEMYLSFVENNLKNPLQILWMIEQYTSFKKNGTPENWEGDKSSLFPSKVYDFYIGSLSRLPRKVIDELPRQGIVLRSFFLELKKNCP